MVQLASNPQALERSVEKSMVFLGHISLTGSKLTTRLAKGRAPHFSDSRLYDSLYASHFIFCRLLNHIRLLDLQRAIALFAFAVSFHTAGEVQALLLWLLLAWKLRRQRGASGRLPSGSKHRLDRAAGVG